MAIEFMKTQLTLSVLYYILYHWLRRTSFTEW